MLEEVVLALNETVTNPLESTERPESYVGTKFLEFDGVWGESEFVTHNKLPLLSYFATKISCALFDSKSKEGLSENLTSQLDEVIP
ncbi:MAG: Uncharacterised protein [Methanobacteriota archaeon]|nr:MAG: Uncharacterised protein [Euryarchaeota archaeon]